jgi:GT2 family glycosyltransferase
MPVFNGAPFLAQTLDSILGQTLTNWELVVVDDASTDNSWSILRSIASVDSRIKIHRNEKNQGHRATSNLAFSLTKGQYVARTDQDDISLPNRLQRQADFLDQHPEVGLLAAGHYRLFPDGRCVAIRKTKDPISVRWGLLFGNIYCHSTFMFRRAFVEGPNVYRYAPSVYDYEVCARLARQTEIRAIPDPLVAYRIHSAGLATTDRSAMVTAALAVSAREIRRLLAPRRLTRPLFCCLHRLATGQEVKRGDLHSLPLLSELMTCFQNEVGASDRAMKAIWRDTLRRLVSSLPASSFGLLVKEDPVGVGDSILRNWHKKAVRPVRRIGSLLRGHRGDRGLRLT